MQITINGKVCQANDGDYVLQIARANDIFIPAICYLNGCSPTLACRMCMCEIDGKRAYACNTKAKDGMVVESNTQELWDERNAIMQTYCVNHPLQCGVCDKSGECELQNFTRWAKVSEQRHWVREIDRRHQDWGALQYDPSLCIVCERCITVCKDKIGDSALKTIARGGEQPDKSFKDTMGKDSYAVWTKFAKSLIAPASGEQLDCQACAECVAVCPTGAIIRKDFQYRSNAWELARIPAANPHSSDCELLYYDVKQRSIADNSREIYRVSNEFHFGALSRAARFAHDIATPCKGRDEAEFSRIVKILERGEAKNIKFNSFITNEEAMILQLIAKKCGANLVNEEARHFQGFLRAFARAGGQLGTPSENVKNSDFIICAGTLLRHDAAVLSYAVNNALVMNKGAGIFAHPIRDEKMSKWSKNFIHLATADTAALLRFILQRWGGEFADAIYEEEKITEKKSKDAEGNEIVEKTSQMLQKSALARQIGLDEDKLADLLLKKQNFALILGADCFMAQNAAELAELAARVQSKTPFSVFLIPPCTNSLGVALLCDLQPAQPGFTFGYNERADFSFSSDSGANLAASALLQQEGTFTNYDLRCVPTNAALPFDGYFLNDLACALGICAKYTIDYTAKLPREAGFSGAEFDALGNDYGNDGSNLRGYALDAATATAKMADGAAANAGEKPAPSENPVFLQNAAPSESTPKSPAASDGADADDTAKSAVIYLANPVGNPSKFSNKSQHFNVPAALYCSADFLSAHGLSDGAMVKISRSTDEIIIKALLDKDVTGGAYLPSNDTKINPYKFFAHGRFAEVKIKEIK